MKILALTLQLLSTLSVFLAAVFNKLRSWLHRTVSIIESLVRSLICAMIGYAAAAGRRAQQWAADYLSRPLAVILDVDFPKLTADFAKNFFDITHYLVLTGLICYASIKTHNTALRMLRFIVLLVFVTYLFSTYIWPWTRRMSRYINGASTTWSRVITDVILAGISIIGLAWAVDNVLIGIIKSNMS